MKTTIREEIESILTKPIYSNEVTEEIIKVFTKMIDEKIHKCSKGVSKSDYKAHGDSSVICDICKGFMLEELKEELEK